MQNAYHFSNQGPFANLVEGEKKHRYCKLHIQTWVYIHSAISMLTSIIGIAIGVIFLTKTEWHEKLFIYRLTLAYVRRADPYKYWMIYRSFFAVWIFLHFSHLATIMITIAAVQKSSTALLKPQLILLIIQLGVLILGLSGLLVISVTGSRLAWDTIGIILFHLIFVSTNLVLLATYHRFLDDKVAAFKELLLTQAKSVHFKDNGSDRS